MEPRACHMCTKFTLLKDGIRCGTCDLLYHMECINYIGKAPSRGYSCECPLCTHNALGNETNSDTASQKSINSKSHTPYDEIDPTLIANGIQFNFKLL
jgi:hypothetical protein